MGKASKANGTAAGDWASEEEWHFQLIQPIAATAIKTAINLDRRIAGSPDRPTCVFVGSSPKPFSLPA